MLGFLWRLVFGRFSSCVHNFEIYETSKVRADWGEWWTRYHLRCKNCGKMKCFNMK